MGAPLAKWKEKGIDVALWPTRNGGTYATIKKSYKDKQTGEWKDTTSLYKSDLEILAKLIPSVIEKMGEDVYRDAVQAKELVTRREEPAPPSFNDDDIPF